jgi:hypothetical protein
MSSSRSNTSAAGDRGQDWEEIVRHHVESLRFGAVEIIVHDSRVIQIEKKERVRFGKSGVNTCADTPRTEATPEIRFPKQ